MVEESYHRTGVTAVEMNVTLYKIRLVRERILVRVVAVERDRKREGARGYLLVRMKGAKSSRDKAEALDVTTESTSSKVTS